MIRALFHECSSTLWFGPVGTNSFCLILVAIAPGTRKERGNGNRISPNPAAKENALGSRQFLATALSFMVLTLVSK